MKKLSIAAAVLSLSIAAPAFACPGHEGAKTADKEKTPAAETAKADQAKDATPTKVADKAKPAPKAAK